MKTMKVTAGGTVPVTVKVKKGPSRRVPKVVSFEMTPELARSLVSFAATGAGQTDDDNRMVFWAMLSALEELNSSK